MKNTEQIHPFDKATQLTWDDGCYQGYTSKDYANMIGPFGGVIAANLLKAVMEHPKCQGEPIALTINFAAALKDGEFTITATPTRTSRTTQHWIIELSQKEKIAVTGTAVLAKRRETWSETEAKFPNVPVVNKIPSIPVEGLPAWVHNYDMKIVKGIPNLAEPKIAEDSSSIQWIRDEPRRPIDFLSLTSICDAFFPRIFVKRNEMGLIGTVSLTIHFHVDSETLTSCGDKEVLGHARANTFQNGYFDQTGEVWSAAGHLLATTNQMVYYRK